MRLVPALAALVIWLPVKTALGMEPLTGVPGDAANGRAVVLDRERGHCLLCHQVAQLDAEFQGNIGPPLSTVGNRLSAAEIRARVVDPSRINPETVMPAYHRSSGLLQVANAFRDRPILSAQEVEDVVAFMGTLRFTEDE